MGSRDRTGRGVAAREGRGGSYRRATMPLLRPLLRLVIAMLSPQSGAGNAHGFPERGALSSSDGPPVRGGERGGACFVNYLPQDEAVASGLGVEDGGLDAVESQAVVDVLNAELSRILKMKPKKFWEEVVRSISLHGFLDSYLRFRNRWYDLPHRGPKGTIAGIVVGEAELSRRVFMVLYRMSTNRDPGANLSDCLNSKEHAALLQGMKLLDLPKLLDICAIYGHENAALTETLVMNAVRSQPNVVQDISTTLSYFLSIVRTMHQRCSSSLEVLLTSPDLEGRGLQLQMDLLEVMDFINDAVVTMNAFVDAYKPAAVYLSHPAEISHDGEELLNVLARLHDSLLPLFQLGFVRISDIGGVGTQKPVPGALGSIFPSLKMLSLRIAKFGWNLLDICYLSDDPFEDSLCFRTTTKIFPAMVEDPVIRGDILVQTLAKVNGEISMHIQDIRRHETFLQNIERKYSILARISSLRGKGWIFLDEEQFRHISGITTSSFPSSREEEPPKLPAFSEEDTAIMESRISQVKDLFPDYGNGFLAACLEVYDHNPEEVIQRILDGTLHKDLLSLDRTLEQVHLPRPAPAQRAQSSKGKEVLTQAEPPPPPPPPPPPSSSSSSSQGKFFRKTEYGAPDAMILDSRAAKDSVRAAVLEAQYEDEYDDSFDELGLSVVESGTETADASGNRIRTEGGSSRWQTQRQPQYYVKDGKNYSYKVSGSVPVVNSEEAALVNQAQRETIHGLGRGGIVLSELSGG
ncbi:unnamed protein product [Spirodela intermedia]|uniref:CUE domain-containing protein n=1 Tax=Spirodela intermedia TaxID=51605 RepID=A0A7I8JB15_SPIIN|nr:unnamed protein product [Spirodela intermedia]CAA6667408.1 unnamed protein product [Spirodela intermedia]